MVNKVLRQFHVELREKYGKDALLLSISHQWLNEIFREQFEKIQAASELHYQPYQTSNPKVEVNIRTEPGWTISDIDENSTFRVSGKVKLDFNANLGASTKALIKTRTVDVQDFVLTIIGDQYSESGISIKPSSQNFGNIYSFNTIPDETNEGVLDGINLKKTEYLILEEAFLLVSNSNIAGSLSKMFDIPPFRKLLTAVNFVGPLEASSHNDRLVISGKPKIEINTCAYNGSGKKYKVTDIPDDKTEEVVCGSYLGELLAEIIVSYPKEVFQFVIDMKASVRPSVRDWGDRKDTIHYVTWDVSLALISANIKFDTNNLTISLDTIFEPSGYGEAGGVLLGCDGTRTKIVSVTIPQESIIDSSLKAFPCIDDKHVFLRVVWKSESYAPLKYKILGAAADALVEIIRIIFGTNLSHKLNDSVRDEASKTLEFPLIALDGLYSPFDHVAEPSSPIRSIEKDLLDNSIMLGLYRISVKNRISNGKIK